jgi:hypothetical protein
MKKLLFVPLTLALVAPLALCATNLTDTANAQGTATTSETLSPVPVLTKDWYRYTAKDGSYSALFPGQPEETVESDFVQVGYFDRANNRAYMTFKFKLRANSNQNESEKVIDEGIASITQNGATVTDQKKISLNGMSGREITVRCKDGLVIKMRALIDPKESLMYMAGVGHENGDLDFPEAQAFLDSMSIK